MYLPTSVKLLFSSNIKNAFAMVRTKYRPVDSNDSDYRNDNEPITMVQDN